MKKVAHHVASPNDVNNHLLTCQIFGDFFNVLVDV